MMKNDHFSSFIFSLKNAIFSFQTEYSLEKSCSENWKNFFSTHKKMCVDYFL